MTDNLSIAVHALLRNDIIFGREDAASGIVLENHRLTWRYRLFIDSIYRGKMEQILLADGFPKETVAAIMVLYKTLK